MHFNFGAGFIKWVKISLDLSTWLFSSLILCWSDDFTSAWIYA